MVDVFGWNPFEELNRFRQEVDRLLNELPHVAGSQSVYPPINVWRGEDGVALVVALPGYSEEQVEVTCSGKTVTISGRRPPTELQEGEVRLVDERFQGEFQRTLEMPFEIDAERATATFERGLLLVSLVCSEKERPRRIEVRRGE